MDKLTLATIFYGWREKKGPYSITFRVQIISAGCGGSSLYSFTMAADFSASPMCILGSKFIEQIGQEESDTFPRYNLKKLTTHGRH